MCLIILDHISALQTQVLLNPGFGKAIGNSLHFPARGTAPKSGFPKLGSGQTWVSGVLIDGFTASFVSQLFSASIHHQLMDRMVIFLRSRLSVS